MSCDYISSLIYIYTPDLSCDYNLGYKYTSNLNYNCDVNHSYSSGSIVIIITGSILHFKFYS